MLTIHHRVYIALPPIRVFSALTDASAWAKWFVTECVMGRAIGDEVRFVWKAFGVDHIDLEDGGRVIEYSPPHRFGFTWSPGASETSVHFMLESRGAGTILSLEETGYTDSTEDFEALKGCSTGWGEALTLFKFYLEHGITYGPIPKQTENPMKRISKVTKLSWAVTGATTVKLIVEGETSTTGWKDFTLVPVEGQAHLYDAMGREPSGSGDAITPISFEHPGLPGGNYTVTVRGDHSEASAHINYEGGHPI